MYSMANTLGVDLVNPIKKGQPIMHRLGTPVLADDGRFYVLVQASGAIPANTTTCSVNPSTFIATSTGGVYTSPSTAMADGDSGYLSKELALAIEQIGGVAIGEAGTGFYSGYTLSWGDDFNTLDIVSPSNSRGKWFTTRTYLPGARGSDTLLGTMFDTDPYFTGHNDSNRGVQVGYNNMSVESSALRLNARKATAPEQAHMSSVRNEVSAMISGAGAVNWYPAIQNTDDIIYEARINFSAAAGNPAGWHPTLWLMSLNPVISFDSDELDWEGNSQNAFLNQNLWTGGSSGSATAGVGSAHTGTYRIISFVINTTQVRLYIDGALYATGAWNGNSKSKPQYPLVTNHIYNGGYQGESYSAAAWNADGDGATLLVDYMRVWRRSSKAHYKPQANVNDVNVNYGASIDVVIPAAATLWSDGTVTEYLQAIYHEENEPGVTHATAYQQFPTGVSYNSGARTLTVNITSGKTGRINFVMSAHKNGSTGEPLRFAVNVGPNILISGLNFTNGQVVNYDLYVQCDCGVLTSSGASKAKTISVSGLSGSGLSYSDSTGLITGTFVAGTYPITVNCTNSAGQVASKNMNITTGASYAYESWTGVGWFDASDPTTITLSGSQVTAIANKRSGKGDLTGQGPAANRVIVSSAQNGRDAIRITRDVSTNNPPRFAASVSSLLSQAFQGNDKPYTVIIAYKPTDLNTGYLWTASDTIDVTDSQSIALIRRTTNASVRRQVVSATPNDVSWGAGQASGVLRIVAVKHTGTSVTVWDNSTTAIVNAAAQDVATFNSELIYYLFAVEQPSNIDPLYANVQCALDFYENIVEDTARSDADVQQCITDLAAKWAITLS